MGVVADNGSVPVAAELDSAVPPGNEVAVMSRPNPVEALGVVDASGPPGVVVVVVVGAALEAAPLVPGTVAAVDAGVLIKLRGVGDSI